MSEQPHKQRAADRTASLHQRHKQVRSTLSEALREEHGVRRVRVNAGDTVEVMRGDFAGHEDEVVDVDLREAAVHVEGVVRETADGEEVPVPLDASNLRVVDLDLEDQVRADRIESRGEGGDEA